MWVDYRRSRIITEKERAVFQRIATILEDHVWGYLRVVRLPRQLCGISPFGSDCLPSRVPIFKPWSGRPALPFPHPQNPRPPRITQGRSEPSSVKQRKFGHSRHPRTTALARPSAF